MNNFNAKDFAYISPVQWLRGIQEASFVITDSFHGTVFSILFNVPFIAVGNRDRGIARFSSLLKMFRLEDRLLSDLSGNAVRRANFTDIDWFDVNRILERERSKAINFLKSNLS